MFDSILDFVFSDETFRKWGEGEGEGNDEEGEFKERRGREWEGEGVIGKMKNIYYSRRWHWIKTLNQLNLNWIGQIEIEREIGQELNKEMSSSTQFKFNKKKWDTYKCKFLCKYHYSGTARTYYRR